MSLVDRYELLSWIAMQSKVLHQQAQKCHYNSCTTQKFASESVYGLLNFSDNVYKAGS